MQLVRSVRAILDGAGVAGDSYCAMRDLLQPLTPLAEIEQELSMQQTLPVDWATRLPPPLVRAERVTLALALATGDTETLVPVVRTLAAGTLLHTRDPSDFHSRLLSLGTWLGDDEVNALGALLTQPDKGVYVLSSFVLERLGAGLPFASFLRALPRHGTGVKCVLVPWYLRAQSHWALLAVDVPGRALRIYDSMAGHDMPDALLGRFVSLLAHHLDVQPWLLPDEDTSVGMPQQEDGSSCGVYMLQAIHALAQGLQPDDCLDQASVPFLRVSFAAELVLKRVRPII